MNLAIPRKDEPELEQALSEAVEAEEAKDQDLYNLVYKVYKPQFVI
jgi:hypothetical protein